MTMIKFFTISSFRNRLESLLKIKRGVYSSVRNEIVREFKGKSIEEIRNNRDMILLATDFIVIKLRLPDKKQHLSKKDGYRLIYLVLKMKEAVVFLDIYPKNGPSHQIDISEDDLARMINQFAEETRANTLVEFSDLQC